MILLKPHNNRATKLTNNSLAQLSLSDLQQLNADIKLELAKREQQKFADARKQILAIAQSVGMDLKDLVGKKSTDKLPSRKVAAKYRNPEDARQQWSGRGRKPKWVETLLAAGRTLAEIEI
jgi:DNA-binding protein H-NS